MQTSTGELLTVSEIARRLDVPVHVVTYVVKTRRIQPQRWAGHARLFDERAVLRIQSELNRIRSADTN
jgi:DNA-binding transcriptional MerR regulator